jgi:hypothetical protein
MRCKTGYKADSPLCAVCEDGFFHQLRECRKCDGSRSWSKIALTVGSLLLMIGLIVLALRHREFLASTGVFTDIKVRLLTD